MSEHWKAFYSLEVDGVKEQLKSMIISNIEKWTDTDIYAISLYVYDECDNPCQPTVTLGYNTERQFKESISRASDEEEARWNYAFWIMNHFLYFGSGDTAEIVRNWINEIGMPYYADDDPVWRNNELFDEILEKTEGITKAFVDVLVCIVKEIHEQGILTQKFGKEIPIIIHELEYYEEIAEQNIEANGKELVEDFVKFCLGE